MSNNDDIRENILSPSQWLRILLMIGFGILSWLLRFAQIVIAFIQILFALVTGRANANMRKAGTLLALYQAQVWLFLSYASDVRPYPFTDLPDSGEDLDEVQDVDAGGDGEGPRPGSDTTRTTGAAAGSDRTRDNDDDVFSDMSFTDTDSEKRRGDDSEDVPTLDDVPGDRRGDDENRS